MEPYISFLRERLGHALIVGATASLIGTDPEDRVLLVRRSDDNTWNVPGGWITPGESVAQTAVREFEEETGWGVEITGLLGIYSEPDEQTHRYSNGDEVQFLSAFFEGVVTNRIGDGDCESVELRFFPRQELPADITPTDRPALHDWSSRRPRPVIR